MTDSNLTFFDIPCAGGHPWSPNTEKVSPNHVASRLFSSPPSAYLLTFTVTPFQTRLSLNFKGLKYKTILVEYPDIKPLLSSLGTRPNASGFDYSCPALRVGNDVPFMESLDHVRFLDKAYPNLPTLLPPGSEATLERMEKVLSRFMSPLFQLIVYDIPKSLLGPGSAPYFKDTREKNLGELSKVAGEEGSEKREALYARLDAGLKPLVEMLKEKDGPFFEGQTPSFVDLKFTAFLYWALRAKKEVFERLIKSDESLPIIWEATAKWRDMGYNGAVTRQGQHAKL